VFYDADDLITWGAQYGSNASNQYFESLLLTKDKKHKIIRLKCAPIKKQEGKNEGIILIGNEIIAENEKQNQFKPGSSYLILQHQQDIIDLFCTLVFKDAQGLVITRGNIDSYKPLLRQLNIKVINIGEPLIENLQSITDINELNHTIQEFIDNHSKPIILIDRIDYLMIKYSYDVVLNALYTLNSIISESNAILLLRINPGLFTTQQIALLKEEFLALPGQEVKTIELSENLYDILQYVDKQNQQHIHLSFSKIQQAMKISKVTTSKRIYTLQGLGLIEIQKKGKINKVYITTIGKKILENRKSN